MQTWTMSLAALAWISLMCDAGACELLPGPSDRSPIETRKPVHGDDVRLTAGFGMRRHPLLEVSRMHLGVDWAAPQGTPVTAAGAGRVVFASAKGEYGNAVLVDHGAGWQTLYSQLARFNVHDGDCVAFGAVIGQVGTTGLSTGPHLHFEVHRDGVAVDPMHVRVKNAPSEIEDNK